MTGAVTQTVLAFDYGTRKVGVAVGSVLTGEARALEVVQYVSNDILFLAVGRLVAEWGPDLLVVGRPLDEAGEPCEMTAPSDRFARRLAGRLGLPVDRVDERYSSVAAGSALLEAHEKSLPRGRRRPRRLPASEDSAAAAIILRQYLSERTGTMSEPQAPGDQTAP
jgi:putative Holliday junction resolvase